MTKNRKKIVRFFSNNWVVTLTATLIGVFTALYLNEIVASRKLENKRVIAKQNILAEINQNRESLKKSIDRLEQMLNVVSFIDPKMDNEGAFVTLPDSIAYFKTKYPKVLKIDDSIKLDDGRYKYKGKVDLDFDLSHLNLTTLSLKTLKTSGLNSSFDFNCLVNLERLEKFTEELLQKEKNTLEKLYKTIGTEKTDEFINSLKTLITFEKALLEYYVNGQEVLKNCN